MSAAVKLTHAAAFFCSFCGHMWIGRVWIEDGTEQWEPGHQCPKCGSDDIEHEEAGE